MVLSPPLRAATVWQGPAGAHSSNYCSSNQRLTQSGPEPLGLILNLEERTRTPTRAEDGSLPELPRTTHVTDTAVADATSDLRGWAPTAFQSEQEAQTHGL